MSTEQKVLYLVRHAKSSWDDVSLSDLNRPLNKRGRRSAPEMGRRMKEQDHRPDLIVSSPAKRAYSTAKKIGKVLGFDKSNIITDSDLYFSGMRNMVNVLEVLNDDYQKVMMVGHNPAMTGFLNMLCNISVINMPTCAIAVIGFDIESWADLYQAEGELLGYDYPKGPGNFIDGAAEI
jgi:phosphohistidine phosphatase